MPITKPTKIAVLADVHANWPALKAVLSDLNHKGISEIWYLGDFIGYGPYPQRVITELQKCVSKAIVGNYDLNVLNLPHKRRKWVRRKDPSKMYSYEWTFKNLKKSDKDYLGSLPQQETAESLGRTFLLVHGSPEKIDEPLLVTTPKKRFIKIAQSVTADVVLCGHTHKYFSVKHAGKYFINPGSVGRSFDGDPSASYVVLESSSKGIAVHNVRVAYDVSQVIAKMKKENFPQDICDSISSARHLDQIFDARYEQSAEKDVLKEVFELARSCSYEEEHSHQVTKLALRIYDELQELHNLTPRHRLLLQSASLLHDIGWIKGKIRHHKTARDIILQSFNLPLTREEKVVVAMVARYHRRSIPRASHKYYSDLSDEKRVSLKKLAGILRVADGLDRRHISAVQDLQCEIDRNVVAINIEADDFSEAERDAALKKADLFRDVFKKDICINWQQAALH